MKAHSASHGKEGRGAPERLLVWFVSEWSGSAAVQRDSSLLRSPLPFSARPLHRHRCCRPLPHCSVRSLVWLSTRLVVRGCTYIDVCVGVAVWRSGLWELLLLLTCTAAWSLAAMIRLVAEHLRGVYSSPLFSVVDIEAERRKERGREKGKREARAGRTTEKTGRQNETGDKR